MNESDPVAEAVARTVRSLRAAHGWSMDQLAGRAGVSKGVLVALEQGRGNPNLGTLIRIADALGVALTRLVQVEEEPPVRLFPPARHVTLWRGPAGGTGVLLAGSDPRPSVELWRWELQPEEVRASEAHLPGTREIAHVETGTLTLTVDGHRYTVEPGTAAAFHGDRPHAYCNEGPEVCRFVLAVMDP
ncbi:XRE family transcriptional regulator [Actinomadura craniellae]|uniref:XRE family transcriptional regulator n=1 Tax=Actinomadura craniellae TaxID=2231787 RepID=A0A365H791_9ACTN|nr:XRE family transcriptional regulator [Actinomadura craniellae]RAY14941.1 XRE family transcriptional regulator [Actinomadura craniellae]